MLVTSLFADPVCKRLVRGIREHLGLGDPTDRSEVALNLQVASRDQVAACVRKQLNANADQYDDHTILNLVPLVLNWEDDFDLTDPTIPTPDDPEEAEFLHALADAIRSAIKAIAIPDLLINFFVEHITDRIIEGDLAQPRPLPALFRSSVNALPFADDTLLLAYVTRVGDIDRITDELRTKYHECFVPGERDRWPGRADRDTWILSRYMLLKDAMESEHPEDPCIPLQSGPTYDEPTLYDLLLNQFMESPYAGDFDHYDLDTPKGQKRAKGRLRKIVNDQRNLFRKQVKQAEMNARLRDPDSYQ